MESNKEERTQYVYQSKDWPWVWAIRAPEILAWQNGLEKKQIRHLALLQDRIREAPLQILEHILIGSQMSVLNAKSLKQMGVTHVLNMAGASCAVPFDDFGKQGIAYKEIESQDAEDYPLLELHWNEASEFIRQAREKGGKCVVNCGAGLNRSGLVVAAEAMLCEKTTVLEVVRNLRKSRGNWALTNESFQEQLVALARKKELLGPAPGEEGSVVKEKAPHEERRTPDEEADGMLLICN